MSSVRACSPVVALAGLAALALASPGLAAGPREVPARPVAASAVAPTARSAPIELDDAAATPSPDEVVGGFHVVFVALAVAFLIGIIVIFVLESSHHHLLHDSCEECRHHHHRAPPYEKEPGWRDDDEEDLPPGSGP